MPRVMRCADSGQWIRIALLVAAGLWAVSPSTAQAQEESKDGDRESDQIYEGYMEVRLSGGAEPETLIRSREFEEFLGKMIEVRHKALDAFPVRYVLQTILVTQSGSTMGQCTSGSANLIPGEPMSFPDVCFEGSLTKGLHEAGVETLTIEKTQWVDGKPVNMGLWARENLDKSTLGLSIVVTTERNPDGEIAGGGTLVMKLSYPPQQGY